MEELFIRLQNVLSKSRKEGQDIMEYVNEWEENLGDVELGVPGNDKAKAFQLLHSARLSDSDFRLVLSETEPESQFHQVKSVLRKMHESGAFKSYKMEGKKKVQDDKKKGKGKVKQEEPGSSAELKVVYDSRCWNCSKTEVKLTKCEGCQKAEYCSRECWEEDQLVHGPWCRNHCWGCEKTGVKLGKCGGCEKARYCGRQCIERDWNTHKHYCFQKQEERGIGKE